MSIDQKCLVYQCGTKKSWISSGLEVGNHISVLTPNDPTLQIWQVLEQGQHWSFYTYISDEKVFVTYRVGSQDPNVTLEKEIEDPALERNFRKVLQGSGRVLLKAMGTERCLVAEEGILSMGDSNYPTQWDIMDFVDGIFPEPGPAQPVKLLVCIVEAGLQQLSWNNGSAAPGDRVQIANNGDSFWQIIGCIGSDDFHIKVGGGEELYVAGDGMLVYTAAPPPYRVFTAIRSPEGRPVGSVMLEYLPEHKYVRREGRYLELVSSRDEATWWMMEIALKKAKKDE